MPLSLWLALAGAGALISFTPGAGAINTMSNALTSGWARSIWGILGQQVALLVHVLIVAAGVGVVVAGTPWLFDTIRYVGAAYLVYLGVRQFLARPGAGPGAESDAAPGAAPGVVPGAVPGSGPGVVGAVRVLEPAVSMFRRGLLVNLTNPKAIVFFLAFVPQFVRPDRPMIGQYAVLTATVVVIDIVVMWFFFATMARGLGRLASGEAGSRVVNRLFGSLFVGVGVLLAAMH